jgi:PAT family beta-lactamase induction signal transducer AmpG
MTRRNRSGWSFVPLLYFLEGLPYVIINSFSTLMYNQLGVPKTQFALWTSIVGFAWTLKMFWGPLVDTISTKRRWIVLTQCLLFGGLVSVACVLPGPQFFTASIAIFGAMALLSATHDIAADGFYLLALNETAQALFVGVRSTFYRLATIFGSGVLVWLAGRFLTAQTGAYSGFDHTLRSIDDIAARLIPSGTVRAWTLALLVGALVYGVCVLVNAVLMPLPDEDRPQTRGSQSEVAFVEAFRSFFKQAKIGWILAFILTYRFGESMIGKLSGTFLLDPASKGGLGVRTEDVGLLTGIVGVIALLIGGIVGGVVISRYGIKRCFWPMVLALNIPNLFYVWAALSKPGLLGIGSLIAIDQFGYGFGFAAYMVYLMFVSQGSAFQTSNYAIATGIMALGALIAGAMSGLVYDLFARSDPSNSYLWFFVTVLFCGIPGMLTLLFIPMDRDDIRSIPVGLD